MMIPDNSAVQEQGNPAVFQLVNGGKLWITRVEDLAALGYGPNNIHIVPPRSLSKISNIPKNGTLVRELGDHAVYYLEDGNRFWVSSPEVLAAMGRKGEEVRNVSTGTLNSFPRSEDITLAAFPTPLAARAKEYSVGGSPRYKLGKCLPSDGQRFIPNAQVPRQWSMLCIERMVVRRSDGSPAGLSVWQKAADYAGHQWCVTLSSKPVLPSKIALSPMKARITCAGRAGHFVTH
ncbi:hypothetical protein [Sinosporangium siamense]|nr:hypothetical protein [Sinosporangium siamense]